MAWKLKAVPAHVPLFVFMNPLAALATMNPLRPVVISSTSTRSPPVLGLPALGTSVKATLVTSPGFISKVSVSMAKLDPLAFCGLGGPVGTPLWVSSAKLTGSTQLGLGAPQPDASVPAHSRLSMLSATVQCVWSMLTLSGHGPYPGG